jgi:hypothetical protein
VHRWPDGQRHLTSGEAGQPRRDLQPSPPSPMSSSSNILSTFFPPASGESPTPVRDDCASCRLTGGLTALALAAYAGRLAQKAPKGANAASLRGGLILGGLGVCQSGGTALNLVLLLGARAADFWGTAVTPP